MAQGEGRHSERGALMAGTESVAGSVRGVRKAFEDRLKHGWRQKDLDIDNRKQ